MRLIDADELMKDMVDYAPIQAEMAGVYDIKWLIDAQITVDAVEVVRCKDCVSYDTTECATGFGWCALHDRGKMDYNFCSCGGKCMEVLPNADR